MSDVVPDRLLAGAGLKAALGAGGPPDGPKRAFAGRALNAGMDHYPAGDARDGYGRRGVVTGTGRIEPEVPRDRRASFGPQPIAEGRRRFPDSGDEIVPMCARG